MPLNTGDLSFRTSPCPQDAQNVWDLVSQAGVFSPQEVGMARELVRERLLEGPGCGYFFIFCEQAGNPLGYACYGPRDDDPATYDLYWIVVRRDCLGMGIGTRLLHAVLEAATAGGGRSLVAETSSTPPYAGARLFYGRHGFVCTGRKMDFYGPRDDLLEYTKHFAARIFPIPTLDYATEKP